MPGSDTTGFGEGAAVWGATGDAAPVGGNGGGVVAGCEPCEITPLVERIRQWVFGDYSIDTPTGPAKVPIGGAIGTAASQPSDNVQSLIGRADSAMYADKAARRAL